MTLPTGYVKRVDQSIAQDIFFHQVDLTQTQEI